MGGSSFPIQTCPRTTFPGGDGGRRGSADVTPSDYAVGRRSSQLGGDLDEGGEGRVTPECGGSLS